MTAGGAARVAPQGGCPCAARGRGREPQSQPRHAEIASLASRHPRLLAVLWHVSDHVGGKGSVGLWVQDLGTTGIDCE